jgi:hypothetical protein
VSEGVEYGKLLARVDALESEVKAMREDIQQLLALMNAGKGAWRTLAVLGGAALAIAGLIAAFLKVLK